MYDQVNEVSHILLSVIVCAVKPNMDVGTYTEKDSPRFEFDSAGA